MALLNQFNEYPFSLKYIEVKQVEIELYIVSTEHPPPNFFIYVSFILCDGESVGAQIVMA